MAHRERDVDHTVAQRAVGEFAQPDARERGIVRIDAAHYLVPGGPQLVRSTPTGVRIVLG